MKKRRSVIAMFLVLAIFTLGIGYAQLTDALSITGSASATPNPEVFDGDIYFTKAVATTSVCSASIDADDKDIATMAVLAGALAEVGDEVIATFTIKSESDLQVTMATPSITSSDGTTSYSSEYFSVFTSWSGPQTIPAGGTVDIVVTVKLIKTPIADQSTNFKITLGAATATSGS